MFEKRHDADKTYDSDKKPDDYTETAECSVDSDEWSVDDDSDYDEVQNQAVSNKNTLIVFI